jgi:pimeloyl-ACP methyl ester carboxylesterase
MPYFQRGNIDFFYIDEGKGLPFIFLHGLGGDVYQTKKLYLNIPGIRFISLDFRGHGKTRGFGSLDKLSLSSFSKDILALMEYLQLDQAIVGGISMGAGVALNFVLNFPTKVKGLILSRVAWLDEPQPKENQAAYSTIARYIREWGPKKGQEKFKETDLYKNMHQEYPNSADSLIKQFEYPYVNETFQKFELIPRDAPNYDRCEWEEIKVPALILANRIDPIHPYSFGEVIANSIPNAILKELTSKSIDPEKHTEECQSYIREFIISFLNKE